MARSDFHVAVIGAGPAGLQFTYDLTRRGISHTVYERADEVGGTWRNNDYPGLFIDAPISIYQLSFAKKYDWTRAFPSGPEIQRYLVKTADDHNLRQFIRFNSEVTECLWTGENWKLMLADGSVDFADAVVSATGFLDKPILPNVSGMDSFAGQSFHSSQWPAGLDVTGKRVGILGTGSSGIQLTSALAYRDCTVKQFVRSPQWVEVIKNPTAPRWRRLLGRYVAPHSSIVAKYVMRRLIAQAQLDPRIARDSRWRLSPGPHRVDAQNVLREGLQTIRDSELRSRMTPTFEPGCKRIPKTVRYFEALQRPNVEVVLGGVDRVEPQGLVASDGTLHELDVLIYATGYESHAYMRPTKVTGVGGKTIEEAWADGVYAYRTVSVPDFPNFWIINGPYAPVAHISPMVTAVDQSDYVCSLLKYSAENRVATAPKELATKRFVSEIDEAVPNTIWGGDCTSWYKSGDRVILWPWDEAAYHAMFADLGLEELEVLPVPEKVGQV